MRFQTIISLVLFGFATSCKTPPPIIVSTDFESILASSNGDGVTVEEADSLSFKAGQLLVSNTEEKRLPEIIVTDLTNKKINLQDLITSNTIILSSDIHCAMAFECLLNEYPKKMKSLNQKYQVPPTICLVIKTEYDQEDELNFNKFLAKLTPNYRQLYLISEAEARKINLHFATTRLYVNEEQVVEHMVIGNCNAEKLHQELVQHNF